METTTTLKVSLALFITAVFGVNDAKAQVPQYVNPEGLMAWYAYTAGSTEDGTNNNLDLQNLGCSPAPDRFGDVDNAYLFDGSATYMRRNDFPFPSTEFNTVSLWFKRSNSNSSGTFVSRADSWTEPRTWVVRTGVADPSEIFAQSFFGSSHLSLGATASGTDWHHVVYVRSGNGNMAYLYIDGILMNEASINQWMLGDVDFLVGAAAGPGQYFDGRLDDIGVWETALTACDAKKLFLAYEYTQPQNTSTVEGNTATFTIPDNNDVGFQWQVNNGTGWQDLSNFGQYSGVTSNSLSVMDVNSGNNNNAYRCIIDYDGVCTDITNAAVLTVTSSTGLFDRPDVEVLSVFPNPNNGQFQLDLQNTDFTQKANVTVFDNTGKTVFSSQTNGLRPTIDLGELPNGIYFVHVSENDLVGTARISIIQ